MLEMLIGGGGGKSLTLIPSTLTPLQGNVVAVTVVASGYENGTLLYARVVTESEVNSGFTPTATSGRLSGGRVVFRFTLPVNAENNLKTFMIGVGLDAVSALSINTALAVTPPITIQELTEPVGQVTFLANTSWTVPPRVTKLSGVLIGGGGGTRGGSAGGGGGGLVYFNDYPVKAGDVFKLTFWSVDSTSSGGIVQLLINNIPIVYVSGGSRTDDAYGGSGGSVSVYDQTFKSYCVARNGTSGASANSTNGGLGGKVGNYRSATPVVFGEPLDGVSGTLYGAGRNGSAYSGTEGGGSGISTPAAARLIWGPGRSYPDNAVDAPVVT